MQTKWSASFLVQLSVLDDKKLKRQDKTRQARDKHTRHKQGMRSSLKEREIVFPIRKVETESVSLFVSAAWHVSPSCCRTARCLATARGGTAQPVPAPANVSV
eukprot:COSAG06_NODE_3925_length_4760_cov_17.392620_5_plen_103_part_00